MLSADELDEAMVENLGGRQPLPRLQQILVDEGADGDTLADPLLPALHHPQVGADRAAVQRREEGFAGKRAAGRKVGLAQVLPNALVVQDPLSAEEEQE